MQEHDVRLLYEAGQLADARIVVNTRADGWFISLSFAGDTPQQYLHSKRGGRRLFRTSDAALAWCREIGLQSVTAGLNFDPGRDS